LHALLTVPIQEARTMTPFIRAAEIWLPSEDQALLVFGGGLFGEALNFAATSRTMCFARAEGLPGQVWDQGRPILLKQLEGSDFRRSGAAKLAGLGCAAAMPFFVGDRLTAVLVLFGGESPAFTGAFELWRNDPRVSSDMTLDEGSYGDTGEAFEQLSRDTFLPRGVGLPGLAWQKEEAVIMASLGEGTRFLRGDAASDAGICRGLAMPCSSTGLTRYVLAFLSGQGNPIAKRMERWVLDRPAVTLRRAGGHCETAGELAGVAATVRLGAAQGFLGDAIGTASPRLCAKAQAEDGPLGEGARASGAERLIVIPIISEDQANEAVVLYL